MSDFRLMNCLSNNATGQLLYIIVNKRVMIIIQCK